MQSYHVVAACAGYTRNAVTSKALTLISGAPDTRAQHSLLNSETDRQTSTLFLALVRQLTSNIKMVKVEKEKLEAVSEFCCLGDMLSAGGGCELAAVTPRKCDKGKFCYLPLPFSQTAVCPLRTEIGCIQHV